MDFGALLTEKRMNTCSYLQLSTERVNKITDVVSEGDIVKVKFVGLIEESEIVYEEY